MFLYHKYSMPNIVMKNVFKEKNANYCQLVFTYIYVEGLLLVRGMLKFNITK